MQRKHWAVAVAAAAALAAVVTWQLRRHRAAPVSPSKPAGAAAERHHEHGHGARETPVDEPELRSGPPRVLADDEPAGPARLAGRVVDGAGAPVAGAVVALAGKPARQATSDPEGAFAFEGLLERQYLLTARAPIGVAGPVQARARASAPGSAITPSPATAAPAAPLTLQLRPGGQVTVEIVDEQQRPLRDATVELRGHEVQIFAAPDGSATAGPVVPGSYQLAAWAPGHGRAFLPAMIVPGVTALRLELARGAPVSGRIVDEAGKPVAAASVRYEAAADAVTGSDLVRDAVVSDADGKFAFAALPAGSFRVVAVHAALAPGVTELLTLDGIAPRTDVEVVMPPGAAVRGEVVGAGGEPLAFAEVRIGVVIPGARIVVPPRQVFADASGRFAVSGLQRRQLTALALHPSGASAARTVDTRGGDVAGVTLTVDAVDTISGVVVDAAGKPVESAQVSAFPAAVDRGSGSGSGNGSGSSADSPGSPANGSGAVFAGELGQWQLRGFPRQVTDAAGTFTLTGLAPGEYRLRATRSAAVGGWGNGAAGLAARAGDPAVRLELPAEGGVKGRVTFEDGTAPEQVTVAVGMAQRAFGGGEFMLESLAPQSYQLVVRGPTFRPRVLEVKVEAGKTADLGTVVVSKQLPAGAPR